MFRPLFVYWYGDHRDLHSFPTRRSSDLERALEAHAAPVRLTELDDHHLSGRDLELGLAALDRSEEHTSELQSQSNLVCRLLLEKKNPGAGTRGRAGA